MQNWNKFFDDNYQTIKKICDNICKKMFYNRNSNKFKFNFADNDECISDLYLGLIENDYKRIKSYSLKSNASFATFLTVVVRNLAIDIKRKKNGYYRASVKAKKLGLCATEIEKNMYYGSSFQEAYETMLNLNECRNITFFEALKIKEDISSVKINDKTKLEFVEDIDDHFIEEQVDRNFEKSGSNKDVDLINTVNNILNELDEESSLIIKMFLFKDINKTKISKILKKERYYIEKIIDNTMKNLKLTLVNLGYDWISVREILNYK